MRGRRKWLAAIALVSAVWVLAAPVVAKFLIVRSSPSASDAIIVLSGSAVYDERLQHAAALFHQGRARTILLTNDGLIGGWSRKLQRNPRSIERGRNFLVAAHVPAGQIVELPPQVRRTYDEAVAARAYARTHQLRSLLIVTSAYHARRALWTFNRVLAADDVSVSIDPVMPGHQSPTPELWWLRRGGWQSVAGEYPKFLYYLLAYR